MICLLFIYLQISSSTRNNWLFKSYYYFLILVCKIKQTCPCFIVVSINSINGIYIACFQIIVLSLLSKFHYSFLFTTSIFLRTWTFYKNNILFLLYAYFASELILIIMRFFPYSSWSTGIIQQQRCWRWNMFQVLI